MKGNFKKVFSIIMLLMVLAAGGGGFYFWYDYTHFVKTDAAQITGDLIKILPPTNGKLLEFNVEEGGSVDKGQIIGRMDASVSASIKAPITGIIVKKNAHIGEFQSITGGSTLALIMDPNQIYITAEIEDTELNKIQPGQAVDITIDQYKGKNFTGTVTSIGQAAQSALQFADPQISGDFTKEVQRVPVKISIDKDGTKLIPGTNAIVKIHVK